MQDIYILYIQNEFIFEIVINCLSYNLMYNKIDVYFYLSF